MTLLIFLLFKLLLRVLVVLVSLLDRIEIDHGVDFVALQVQLLDSPVQLLCFLDRGSGA